jgi:hypothetical protein
VPAGIKVCIVADRGFGDQKLYQMLAEELYLLPRCLAWIETSLSLLGHGALPTS